MLVMIAVIKSSPKDIAGFRIIDCSQLGAKGGAVNVKDVDYASVLKALSSGTKVENLEVINGEIKGSNGALSSYTQLTINNEVIKNNTPAVVLYRTSDDKFVMASYMGAVTVEDYESAINLAEKIDVANGKIRTLDGKKVLSSIKGNYPLLEVAAQTAAKPQAKSKFVTVSDDYSEDEIIQRIDKHLANSNIKLIGKIGANKTDNVIKKLTAKTGLLDAITKGKTKDAAESVKTLTGVYIPVIRTIGDRKAIINNLTGLKAVYADVTHGAPDLFERAIKGTEAKALKLGSKV